jgi:hypothetical protein
MADSPPSPSSRQRLRRFFLEFGALGLGVHYFVYLLVLIGFALSMGGLSFGGSSTLRASSGTLGVCAAAYVATKLTMPLRALVTVALTPLLRALIKRVRKSAGRLPVAVDAARRQE